MLTSDEVELLARITAKDMRSIAYAVQHGTTGDERRLRDAVDSMNRALDLLNGATVMA